MEDSNSVQHTTLLYFQEELIAELSKDIAVAKELAEAGLVSQDQLEAVKSAKGIDHRKAWAELVLEVIDAVEASVELFDVFLLCLSKFNRLKNVVIMMEEYQSNLVSCDTFKEKCCLKHIFH